MPNITLVKTEMIFLKEAILKKYCDSINERYETFSKNLTGTLNNYQIITIKITDYIENKTNLISYTNGLEESSFKISLQKCISENQKKGGSKFLELPTVTADILRKLLFKGPLENELAFRDFFVFACYIYINSDRNKVLKKIGKEFDPKKTLKPEEYIPNPMQTARAGTIPPFQKVNAKKISLIPLDEKLKKGEKIVFDFIGKPITLNRMNLDPDNNTITSKIQANIFIDNNEWFIENHSELKTTYIQVIKPVKLEKGDVIIFGNKHFLFDE